MSYKIVVARYNENIEWLKNEKENCVIYNKGNKLNIENEIIVENYGRESETYLRYIIDNYENLPDVVVFTQAYISDHIKGKNELVFLITIKNQALQHSKSIYCYVHDDVSKNPHWDKEWNLRSDGFYLANNYKNNRQMTFIEWFKTHIDKNYPNPINLYTAGIFAVRKDLILKHPVEYYEKLITEVNHHINPAEGHFFERSWYYIFA
jgi:hypothetical protein